MSRMIWKVIPVEGDENAANQADFWGYECKNHTSSKTTWGDWTANYYIFDDATQLTRDRFLQIFGTPNMKKHGRYSWSGKEVPTRHNDITKFGQSLIVDSNLDISIFYNFNKDNRVSKKLYYSQEISRRRYSIKPLYCG